jgi:hypothetical protein
MRSALTIRCRAAAALVVLSTALIGAHPAAAAEGGGADHVVQVGNVVDGAQRARADAQVAYDPAPTVQNQNVAIAESSCTSCRTVAVAVQAVIVEGPVNDFEPANAAVATNDGCVSCATLAYARQEVLVTDHPVVLGSDGQAQVGALEDQMQTVAASSDSFDAVIAELDSLTDQLVGVLQAAVDQGGPAAQVTTRRQVDQHED